VEYDSLLPSRDGRQLFLISRHSSSELLRYDPVSKSFAPYLPTIRAGDVDFSLDGKWMAYVRLPDRTLWRSRPDGSNATQLTVSGAEAYSPHWSPDGKFIAYMSISAQSRYKACVVPVDGGRSEELNPAAEEEGTPTWSRDGNVLAFGDTVHVGHASKMAIHLFDLRNHELSTLPGSYGLWTPRWSPDGRYIVALALGDETKGQLTNCPSLLLYDLRTRRWITLANIWYIASHVWTPDSQYVYFLVYAPEPQLYRVSVATKRVEVVTRSMGFAGLGGDWIGVAPDGSPLIIGYTRIDEIYALDVQWP
jgi:Tol biopolymer transport system component